MNPRIRLLLAGLLAAAFLPACDRERGEEYARERDELAAAVADIEAAQLALLLPKAVPRSVPPQHLPVLVHRESVQDLHERDEAYVDRKEQDIEDLRRDVGDLRRLLDLKGEVERVRALPWRRP
ncbi:MAG: hypothetical protein MUC63_03125 [Planctomycetes bacterium]|jgi:hypothetical protein|nr:hypothetical protein [Planctomycetota bacterium]